MTTAHDFTAKTIDGQDKSLKDYAGKTLLDVNAPRGLTPQYPDCRNSTMTIRSRFEVLVPVQRSAHRRRAAKRINLFICAFRREVRLRR